MPTKKKGRPKKVKDDRRTNVLRIRLTEDERQTLDVAAGVRSLDVSAWARMVLIENARPVVSRAGG
jgi:uncharacterized protein (DUF1778 family)